jgi:hypothetical protein
MVASMLNDHDRRALEEIERHLVLEDPALEDRLAGDARPFPAVLVLCAVFYILAPISKLLFGWAGLEVTAAVFVIAVTTVVILRRSRR